MMMMNIFNNSIKKLEEQKEQLIKLSDENRKLGLSTYQIEKDIENVVLQIHELEMDKLDSLYDDEYGDEYYDEY